MGKDKVEGIVTGHVSREVDRIEKRINHKEKNKTELRTAPHTEPSDNGVNWKERFEGLRNVVLGTVWIGIITIAIIV
ncbi:hypothetical protein GGP41_001308 [Bipolaris sorokiniana]|uniref:Uncharacterized protein n=1 Tax=Cochliobolus sativus TaxID=45130 RepID=A0A8H5ZBM2_COCSA|nr:hypothetical protein GGP41_001308 [Bipolaris sorokiniana]